MPPMPKATQEKTVQHSILRRFAENLPETRDGGDGPDNRPKQPTPCRLGHAKPPGPTFDVFLRGIAVCGEEGGDAMQENSENRVDRGHGFAVIAGGTQP